MSYTRKVDVGFYLAVVSFASIVGGGVWAAATRDSDLKAVTLRQDKLEIRQKEVDERWLKDHEILGQMSSKIDTTLQIVQNIYHMPQK